ncbi:uncharacterized protein LOC119613700 [Lucilia sericata]|uniref:uncharacterized protein LOC119613700 n=1 Tax=Lucilia sericata TaxID=13632 RepID=UPI0018A86555|nr:uncharacterized protein LOC119613700 [Lucilia sericata]
MVENDEEDDDDDDDEVVLRWWVALECVNANPIDKRPFLQIKSPSIRRLIISHPHKPYYLQCKAYIDESSYQNETEYFFTWLFNDKSLKNKKPNNFNIYRNGTLRISGDEKISGEYRCKINANKTAVISESITVEYAVLKRRPANVSLTAQSGLSFTLNCPIFSIPPANVTWYYGNVSLSKNFNENSFLFLNNGSLVIRQVKAENAGKYRCNAHNQYTAKEHRQATLNLNVEETSDDQRPPIGQLIPHLQNTTLYVPLNDDLNLTCCTPTDDVPIEWWFHQSSATPWIKLSNNSKEYHIRNSIEQYEGYYTCATVNSNQTFHVIVTRPPVVAQELPMYKGYAAATIVYQCLVTGNPRPTITWYHNGEVFNSSITRYINGNQLHIESFDPEESGIYQCFARNIAGEVYTAGEIRPDRVVVKANPLKNIRCFAHTFSSVNVTFENESSVSLFVVNIIQNNPFRWSSPFSPMKLNTSYVIIDNDLPYIRPFELIIRGLVPTSDISVGSNPTGMLSTLRSQPVTCCTQGLPLRVVQLGNNTFVTWSLIALNTKKYFIVQFSINNSSPDPQRAVSQPLVGTVQIVNLNAEDIYHKLRNIEALNASESRRVLQNAVSSYSDNDATLSNNLDGEENIFNLVLPGNVTGLMMNHFTRLKLRVLLITSENENLAQDFRYVEWKSIVNDTGDVIAIPYHLTTIESRMLIFHFQEGFNESCVQVCYRRIHFPHIIEEKRKCEKHSLEHTDMEITNLHPNTHYSFHFSSCDTNIFYGQMDVVTLQDPPGTINVPNVTRQNGLKLNWEPPLQPNGKIHHYNILWTLGNVTHEANVLDCKICYYKFPNISESAKINISVRVVGETGVGAPISIDLRHINHLSLEKEGSGSSSQVYSGIAIGSLLSIVCIFGFAILIMIQRKRFKTRQQGPTHLSTPTDIHFGNLSNTGLPGGSAGGLSSTTMPPDCHEMQNLIPKVAGRRIDLMPSERSKYETTQLPNGNGDVALKALDNLENTNNSSILSEYDMGSEHNLSSQPLCKTSPHKKSSKVATVSECSGQTTTKPFFIPFKTIHPHSVAIAQKQSSSTFAASVQTPPNSIALTLSPVETMNSSFSSRRSNSLSSSSNSNGSCSTANSIKSKQFHGNFPKHSTSIDGICLLAEEQTASTPTPTSETDVTAEVLKNGFQHNGEHFNMISSHCPTNPSTSKTTSPTTRTSIFKTKLHNNNNKKNKSKKSTNLQNSLRKEKHQQPQSSKLKTTAATLTTTNYPHNSELSYIVPVTDPLTDSASVSTTSKSLKTWSQQPLTTFATTSSGLATKHKYPNMDPNG